MVLTRPDSPAGRGLRPAASEVKRFAAEHGLPVFQPATLKTPDALERLRAAAPEVLVVAAYGLILPPPVLEVAPYGSINIHASLLPRWRGAAPIQRAILSGDRRTGISIMQMDVGLDTGPVLARESLAIEDEDDAGTLHDKLAALGARMIVETLSRLGTGGLSAEPQPAQGVTYAAKIEKAEARLDWSCSAAQLARFVRAFRPAPGARAKLGGETIKLWRAHESDRRGKAGEVLEAGPDGILVGCGEGALCITELQREGARRLSAAEFLRGHRLAAGDRFG